jgi:hypothetical protein
MAEVVEYRVRPVVRYVVTRWHEVGPYQAGVETIGEFDNEHTAERVRKALEGEDSRAVAAKMTKQMPA